MCFEFVLVYMCTLRRSERVAGRHESSQYSVREYNYMRIIGRERLPADPASGYVCDFEHGMSEIEIVASGSKGQCKIARTQGIFYRLSRTRRAAAAALFRYGLPRVLLSSKEQLVLPSRS